MGNLETAVERLIEREAELERLDALLDAACAGSGGVVLIEAPAGLGKTALLETAAAGARGRGMTVLQAICGELEREFPFGACLQLFADPGAGRDPLSLSGAAGLARPLFEREAATGPEPDEDRMFALLHGLWWLTAESADDSPLLLTIDDAQWADDPSLRFVEFLGRRLDGLPVAICVAARTGEREDDAALEAIRAGPLAATVRLEPLSDGAVAELVATELGDVDEQARAACASATGGNPFYLRQLLATLRERGADRDRHPVSSIRTATPESVSRAVHARIARLGIEAQSLAEALSVLGDGAPLRRAASLAELGPAAASGAAERLAVTHVIRDRDGLSFAQTIVREAVYSELPAARRRHAHGRAAKLLADENCDPELIAAQLKRADGLGRAWAVVVLRAAARRAAAGGAHEAAVDHLRRALDEPPPASERAAVLAELGTAELLNGDPACVERLREALAAAEDPALRARTAAALSRALVFAARVPDAVDALRTAIAELGDGEPELSSGLRAELLGMSLVDLSCRRELAVEVASAVEDAERLDPVTDAQLLGVVALETTLSRSASHAHGLAERALDEGRLLDQVPPDHVAAIGAIATLLITDRDQAAERWLEQAGNTARRSGSVRALAVVACLRSRGAFRWGALAEAEEEGRTALRLATEHGWPFGIPTAIACVADPLIERGELAEARELTSILDQVGELVETQLFQMARECRARLELAGGEPAEALRLALACGKWEAAWGATNSGFTHYPWRGTAALAHLALGEREQAAALAAEQLEVAHSFGTARSIGLALRIVALSGAAEERAAGLERAVETLRDSPARPELAKALADLGGELRRQRRRAAARERLYEALDLARRCGATALASAVREELRAAGARPRREATSGSSALTPSERRVADLAAGDLGNRAIAQRLFLSRRTVETHLTSAYRKLEIAGREELAAALAEPLTAAESD